MKQEGVWQLEKELEAPLAGTASRGGGSSRGRGRLDPQARLRCLDAMLSVWRRTGRALRLQKGALSARGR